MKKLLAIAIIALTLSSCQEELNTCPCTITNVRMFQIDSTTLYEVTFAMPRSSPIHFTTVVKHEVGGVIQ